MELATGLNSVSFQTGAPETKLTPSAGGWQLNLEAASLGGCAPEVLISQESGSPVEGTWIRALRTPDRMAGVATLDTATFPSLEACACALYEELLALTEGLSLYRVWNFVPQINSLENGLERYQTFNAGRWKAFVDTYGEPIEHLLPAASAVGLKSSDTLSLAFIAGQDPVEYVENPRQTPAYHYPPQYGPRSPSFARGAVVTSQGSRTGYLSGTSSIRGHETIGEGDLRAQYEETLVNVRATLTQMSFDGALQEGSPFGEQLRVYLRQSDDVETVRAWLTESLGEAGLRATFLQADICRSALQLEIEGIFTDPEN